MPLIRNLILAAAFVVVSGCHENLPIDDVLYYCTADNQCGDGWECKDLGYDEGPVCVKIGSVPDKDSVDD